MHYGVIVSLSTSKKHSKTTQHARTIEIPTESYSQLLRKPGEYRDSTSAGTRNRTLPVRGEKTAAALETCVHPPREHGRQAKDD